MNEYTVYFEFFGKNYKTKIKAYNEIQAKNKVHDRINFIDVKEELNYHEQNEVNKIAEMLNIKL